VSKDFYLLVDSGLHYCYAATRWIQSFGDMSAFKGILVCESKPSESLLLRRNDFHKRYSGQTKLTDSAFKELDELYPAMTKDPSITKLNRAFIQLFGVPEYSITSYPNTIFLGEDINGDCAKEWVENNCGQNPPLLFSKIAQVCKPWWIKATKSHLLNFHTAVLPYARGIYSIENIAALKDIEAFREAAGATIHFIELELDTGPIIAVERITDPFRFNSIWELKAYIIGAGYDLYADVARRIILKPGTFPAGVAPDPSLRKYIFYKKDFTLDKLRQSEEGFLAMKKSLQMDYAYIK
jgi:phosphoribosylglycinamide formyltransferase 1